MNGDTSRRPLASRGTGWARRATVLLLRTPVTPDQISCAGIGFAMLGGIAFAVGATWPWLFVAGALLVQMRLLCNLFDGLVAVEGGRGGATGILFNELPDRVEDSVLLIGFGYGVGLPEAGFVAALLAVGTAYLRAFGDALGLGQDYRGPMAKPQRMAALTVGALGCAVEAAWHGTMWSGVLALGVIVPGTALTCGRRTARIAAGVARR